MRKRKTGYTIILLKKKYNELKYSMQIQTDEVENIRTKSNAQMPAVYQ